MNTIYKEHYVIWTLQLRITNPFLHMKKTVLMNVKKQFQLFKIEIYVYCVYR